MLYAEIIGLVHAAVALALEPEASLTSLYSGKIHLEAIFV